MASGFATRSALAAEPHAPPAAPHEALELTVAAGYVRFPERDVSIAPIAGEGIGAQVGALVRSADWSLGVVGEYAELDRGRARSDGAHSTKLGFAVTYHLAPRRSFDPWVGLGCAYRHVDTGPASSHGLELARLTLGADLRAASFLAAGPLASIGLDAFPWTTGTAVFFASSFVGVQGRFDLSPAVVGD